ncbi:MAG: heparan-alpha-glucosaminide N-acetyltransferase [Candidatus Caldatribacteriota bacterium]
MSRFPFLDQLRGHAVIWMIIFHFTYDLKALGFIQLDMSSGFWYGFPRFIAFTFLFCVGFSSYFVHRKYIRWDFLKKRSLVLGLSALLISLSTYFLFPDQWIFLGTLHCIFLGSLLIAPLVRYSKLSWTLMIGIIFSQYVLGYDIKWVSSLFNRPSMDFIPIYPWFWTMLLGLNLAPYLSKWHFLNRFELPGVSFLGQHSLKIYLVHQPLIFGTLSLIKWFLN